MRESEDRYKTLVDNSLTAICLIQDQNIQFVNKRFIEMSGYESEELLGRSSFDLVHPEDVEKAIEISARRFAGQDRGLHYQYRVIVKNGKILWIETLGTVVDYQGKPALLLNMIDITDRKMAELALKESEELYRGVVEHAQDIICTIDLKTGVITTANSFGETALGYTLDEVVNKMTFLELIHPDDQEDLMQRLVSHAYDGVTKPNYPFRLKRADGSYIDAEINGEIINDAEGNPNTYIGIIRDITDRKKAEEALRESEEKYKLLVENADEAVYILQDGMIKFANRKTTILSGYSAEELEGMNSIELVHPEDREIVVERYRRRVNGEETPATYSFRVETKTKEALWGQLNAVKIMWEGKPATLNFLRDITVEKQLEAQLQQAQKMESIGTLAGGIAHDFNNLLGSILGFASLAKTKMTNDNKVYEYLDLIEKSSTRAAELTAQLLAFARGGKYEVKPINLNSIVNETLDILGRTFDKSIEMEMRIKEELPTIEADAGQLQQVIMNLCMNARDAMDGGGKLIVQTDIEQVSAAYAGMNLEAKPGQYVTLSVSDTGVGIDKENIKRIFEPFFTTKKEGKGTGLGLAMVYGVVKNHGGFINAYSELCVGTTFKIYLPTSGKLESEELSETLTADGGSECVLVVDDEEAIRSLAKEILESFGYSVMLAENGLEAVELYSNHMKEIDLVIMDMVMPKMGGREAFLKLRGINRDVKTLLSTGYSQDGKAKGILDSGVKGFIQKPYQVDALLAKVRSVLDA